MENQFTIYAQIIFIVIIIILLIIFIPDRKDKVDSEENIKTLIKKIDKKKNSNDFIIDLETKQIKRIKNIEDIRENKESNKKFIKFHRFEKICVFPDDDLKKAIDLMIQFDLTQICVVSKRNPRKLIGVINKEDIMRFFLVKSSKKFSFYNIN